MKRNENLRIKSLKESLHDNFNINLRHNFNCRFNIDNIQMINTLGINYQNILTFFRNPSTLF